ncbi:MULTISPECIES: hypothetical protein [Corynebacterium]|uniref:hypothetical protein n=1 Tax=Corynebacterium TaxID=1716 RepID=UPI0008A26D6A|nr:MULTISPECIES: hypothetical protein [Corynebacterium]ASE57015.1 hypothetical protein CEQ06_08635 [Corynebacterium jeikeium]MDK7200225.1 hypothetical protein [Corynebacterium amycolatum]OFT73315.1 hypothetical protein HMPREF3130_00365 [Corynebacterium sp. HMSC14B06]PLA35008.1 hypothetical protein CYJ42_09485 [Corynebacterium amycolatum]
MSALQIQLLSEAAILAATDELVATVPELADATLARPWTISAIVAASSGVIAGHRSFPMVSAAAQAVAYATFHVKPLSFGNTALGALLAHILLTTNGEELSFAETWDLVKGGT